MGESDHPRNGWIVPNCHSSPTPRDADKRVMCAGKIRVAVFISILVGLWALPGATAHAYDFDKPLSRGSEGRDVLALEIRIAGWFPKADQTFFELNKVYDGQTHWAVARFQRHYRLPVDGIAGPAVFEVLERLEDPDRSTAHFDYSEFWQNRSSSCSRKANSFAGSFKGGKVDEWLVKRNIRTVMWRLEAIRARGGANPIGINSGFRSVAYNACIGGASLSQHMYGTAVDTRMAGATNRRARDLARGGQVHGVGCYSSLSHNHFDLRMYNIAASAAVFWWWPKQDSAGRDLADDNRPCWGETVRSAAVTGRVPAVPTEADIDEWEKAGEPYLGSAD